MTNAYIRKNTSDFSVHTVIELNEPTLRLRTKTDMHCVP